MAAKKRDPKTHVMGGVYTGETYGFRGSREGSWGHSAFHQRLWPVSPKLLAMAMTSAEYLQGHGLSAGRRLFLE